MRIGLDILGASCTRSCEFESQRRILDGSFFTLICLRNCIDDILNKPKIHEKRTGMVIKNLIMINVSGKTLGYRLSLEMIIVDTKHSILDQARSFLKKHFYRLKTRQPICS